MKRVKKFLKWFVITIIIIIIAFIFPTWTPPINGKNSISELSRISINGTKQQIMIRGNDKNNPIIIFVHGGPGCSEIPYVTKYQDILEQYFTIVHYDQRGSGKSYHFFEDYSDLTSQLLIKDLLSITDYISKRFENKKVLLAGHSFGTYIALQAAAKAPEKFIAYIGIGQMSDTLKSELNSLNYCIEQAHKSGNTHDFTYLEGLTDKIKEGSIITPRNYIKKYGGASRLIDENTDYFKGFMTNPEYNLLDVVRYFCGVSVSQNNLLTEAINNPLSNLVTNLKIPCYFVMGQYDYMTSSKAAKDYFDSIVAPEKDFLLYSNSAHYPQFEEKEKFADWMVHMFKK